jgi:hypothetical protein
VHDDSLGGMDDSNNLSDCDVSLIGSVLDTVDGLSKTVRVCQSRLMVC